MFPRLFSFLIIIGGPPCSLFRPRTVLPSEPWRCTCSAGPSGAGAGSVAPSVRVRGIADGRLRAAMLAR